jgi:hypothetical protein
MSDLWRFIQGRGIGLTWKGGVMGKYQWFTDAELDKLQDSTCRKLSIARGIAQMPFVITCGFRTEAQNAALGESVKDSGHLTGNGVDLACSDSQTRYAMIKGLLSAGFTRIGVYSAHIHADDSPTLPPNVIWYGSGT